MYSIHNLDIITQESCLDQQNTPTPITTSHFLATEEIGKHYLPIQVPYHEPIITTQNLDQSNKC